MALTDMIQQAHFDTKVPASAGEYQIWKWKLGVFLHRVIDECFSVQPPTVSLLEHWVGWQCTES